MNELARQLSKVILINRLLGTNAAISERDTQKAVEILEGKHMRILKGWTREERKELEEAEDSGYNSAFDVIYGISNGEGDLGHLNHKYYDSGSISADDQLAKDIVDFYCDNAKFPEQKYVVHDKVTDQYIYCNVLQGNLHWWQLGAETAEIKTKEEWLKINPAYETMLERVED